MSVLVAILLGFLQGIAVFLPISYSGHLAILQNLIGLDCRTNAFFNMLMSLSTVVSILLVYGGELRRATGESIRYMSGKMEEDLLSDGRLPSSARLLLFVAVGLVPVLLFSTVEKKAAALLGKVVFVGIVMLIMGAVLFSADKLLKYGNKSVKTMTVRDAFLIGLGYAFGSIPGLSPVGTAVAVSLASGLKKEFAVRFPLFLMVIPLLFSALSSFFGIFKGGIDWSGTVGYLIGFIISVATGYLAIHVLRRMVAKRHLKRAAFYLWAVGAAAVAASIIMA